MYFESCARKSAEVYKARKKRVDEAASKFKGTINKSEPTRRKTDNALEYTVTVSNTEGLTTTDVGLLCSEFFFGGFCNKTSVDNVFKIVEQTE